MALFGRSHKSSYWRFIVAVALIFEIKRDIGKKTCFYIPAFDGPVMESSRNIATRFYAEKPE